MKNICRLNNFHSLLFNYQDKFMFENGIIPQEKIGLKINLSKERSD
ncbi:hypothetical protein [Empedobacter brevis]|nr:hypothetical protein [Empedobacter brevis]